MIHKPVQHILPKLAFVRFFFFSVDFLPELLFTQISQICKIIFCKQSFVQSELNFTIHLVLFLQEPHGAITLFMIVYLFDITCQHVQQSWPSPACKWAHCTVI